MFEGPFSLSSNRNCVLCGSCIKTCPNQSPVLNVRLPGYDLWSMRRPDRAFVFLVIALLGTQVFRGIEGHGWFSLHPGTAAAYSNAMLLAIGAFLLAALYARAAGQRVFGKQGIAGERDWYRIMYALLPLVFAYEAGHHISRLLTLGGQVLPVLGRQLGSAADLPGGPASPAVVKALQAFLVLLGAVGSTAVLGHLLRTREDKAVPTQLTVKRSWPVLFVALAYLVMFLAG